MCVGTDVQDDDIHDDVLDSLRQTTAWDDQGDDG